MSGDCVTFQALLSAAQLDPRSGHLPGWVVGAQYFQSQSRSGRGCIRRIHHPCGPITRMPSLLQVPMDPAIRPTFCGCRPHAQSSARLGDRHHLPPTWDSGLSALFPSLFHIEEFSFSYVFLSRPFCSFWPHHDQTSVQTPRPPISPASWAVGSHSCSACPKPLSLQSWSFGNIYQTTSLL